MPRSQIRNTVIFAVCLATCVAVLSRQTWGVLWLRWATYFTMFGLFGAWLVRLTAWARGRWTSASALVKDNVPEILLALGAMALVFATHDWEFKVLSDEANLVGVGRSLSSDWRFDFPGSSKLYFGAHHYSRYMFDKRPPLFTFLLSLVNSLTGYRVKNLWYLNASLTSAAMLIAGVVLRRRIGRPWSLLAMVWAVASPIVLQTASAGGVEPTLCLVWLMAGVLALEVLEDPSSPSFPLFVATLMLVAMARLEAGPLALLLLVGVIALSDWRLLLDRVRDDWLVWTAPVVALPSILQKILKSYFQGFKGQVFGFQYVIENLGNWRRVFADGGRYFPYNPIVTVVEVLAVVALVWLVLRKKTEMSKPERTAFLLFAALTAGFVVISSTYYWGQPTKSTSTRFYALPFFFAGLTVPAVARRFQAVRARPLAFGTFTILTFAFAVPVAFNHAFANGIPSRKSHEIVMEYLRPRIWGGRTILLVSPLPAHFHLYDVGAIGFKAFNNDRRTTVDEIERGLYDEVLIQQEIVAATGKPIAKTTLEPDLAKETVFERELDGSHFVRVSRLLRGPDGKVIEIGGDAPKDAPKDSAKDPGKDHPAPDDEPVDDTLAGGQGM